MIVVSGKSSKMKSWLKIKRNLKSDFNKYFDKDVDKIHSIAIMTDTDNSKTTAPGCYGPILISK